ncbi:MAG: hypothetical protein JNM95_04005 [Chitinophagaceae bacterium]|nr:hypothetical protein [Chitinophagaceae bacterium]
MSNNFVQNVLLIFFVTSLFSCSYDKITKVDIENRNKHTIEVGIKTNNVSQSYGPIKAGERMSTTYNWTELNQEEGQFVFTVKHSTGGVDSFTHGFIRKGELYNYVYLISEQDQLKVEISN